MPDVRILADPSPPPQHPSHLPLQLTPLQIKRTVKLITRQRPISEPSPMEGFPMRSWSIEIWLVDSSGNDVPATCFEKAVYNLHPSFEKNKQTFKKPPFKIEEKGWGEFDMTIVLTGAHKGGDHTLAHDLNFQSEKYEATHQVVSLLLFLSWWEQGKGEEDVC